MEMTTQKEVRVKEHPDNYDAELLLRLYDLRREAKFRQAWDWFIREFQASSMEEFSQQCPPATEKNAYFRMNISYWEMAASLVNHGLINETLFFENAGQFWIVWDRVRKLAPAFREQFKNPWVWKNLEIVAEKYEHWMAKRAPEALETWRQRLAAPAPKKAG